MRVRFTQSARQHFLDALRYIQIDNPTAARDFRTKAEAILRRLEKFTDFVCVYGHAFSDKKSQNTNFAFLSKVVLTGRVSNQRPDKGCP